jgi:hypothetical protein
MSGSENNATLGLLGRVCNWGLVGFMPKLVNVSCFRDRKENLETSRM